MKLEIPQTRIDPTALPETDVSRRCEIAMKFEEAGRYEAAAEALGPFWAGRVEHPNVSSLTKFEGAAVLLRVGVLLGHFGSSRQWSGSQEVAKELIVQSAEMFENLQLESQSVDAKIELANCYWREGAFDEARVILASVDKELEKFDVNLRIKVSLTASIIETSARRTNEALQILNAVAPLVDLSKEQAVKGKYHSQRAFILRNIGETEGREDYLDQALTEYAAAGFHFEQAGHTRYLARIENNLGFLFLRLARFPDAHRHLDRAASFFKELGDVESLAQVNESRARTLLAEGRLTEAESATREAASLLKRFPGHAIESSIMTTWGVALARLARADESEAKIKRAILAAENCGDLSAAGRAILTLIEENANHFKPRELLELYAKADEYLSLSREASVLDRLRACARLLVRSVSTETQMKKPRSFHSCFISHSHKDNEFVERLHSRLRRAGVPVWFAPTDVKGGRKLLEQIEIEIKKNEKLLIVLSEHSLQSEWVKTEIREARRVEHRTNRRKLFPISLVDIKLIKDWKCFDPDSGEDLAIEIRQYFIPDFSRWEDSGAFEKAVRKLLGALRAVDADATDSLPIK
jgi:tetratricopeptide (TPR) repeat protein